GIGSDDYVAGLRAAESPAALLERILHTEQPRHDQWQIQCQAMVQAKARVLVKSMLTDEVARSCHVEPVADPSEAVRDLVAQAQAQGRDGSVLVLPYGQLTVPVIE